jgi:CheY-like chemotaxis protein
MGGTIWVESEEKKGSIFYFTCTLGINGSLCEADSITAVSITPSGFPGAKRVLLVEDDEINIKVMEQILRKMNLSIVIASNGREALDILGKDSFDLILMDLQMPVMDGLTATKSIRLLEADSARHIPIIVITAYAQEGNREKCLEAGADDYITKPVNIEMLTGKLCDFLKLPKQ